MNINETYHHFHLLKKQKMQDYDVTLYEFEHVTSGATLVYLENEDTNKCFAAGFRTLPEDSTGICHIIEHSTLCGSDRFPLKEPFVNLLKGSMATFLNAMTARDFTIYPVASQNDKDFANLMATYLDAVFAPLSRKDIRPFLQEGWHLELNSKEDIPSYKGVVYNEMKGAMSDVSEQLNDAVYKTMYKGTGYAVNSGGDPEVIPTLTYDYYKKFYARHYHPENALLMLYGKMDIDERLKYMDEEYLCHYKKEGNAVTIDIPSPLINEDYEQKYAIAENEEEKDNTYMALSFALTTFDNARDLTAFQILNEALMSTNESPLKKVLMDAGLGEDVSAFVDDSSILPCYTVSLEKTNPEEKARFKEVFLKACEDLVKNGIDKELLLATINFNEFQLKEQDTGRMPKGLIYGFGLMNCFNYHIPFEQSLCYSENYKFYKENLENGYFEGLIEKYILHSNHHVQVVLLPSKTLNAEKEAAMNEKMKALKASMSEEEIDFLVKQTKDLIAYQSHKDTPEELATLPTLALEDISTDVNTIAASFNKEKGYEAIEHNVSTNGISYLKLYFDMKSFSVEDTMYARLVNAVLLKLDTEKYTATDLQRNIKLYLGAFGISNLTFGKGRNDIVLKECIDISALDENASHMGELLDQVLNHSVFDENKIKMILTQMKNFARNGIIQNGMELAKIQTLASTDAYDAYAASTGGLAYYRFLSKAIDDISSTVKHMEEVASQMFDKSRLTASLSGSKEAIACLYSAIEDAKLPSLNKKDQLTVALKEKAHGGLAIPSEVSYNAMGTNLAELGETYNGKMVILTHILRYDYLWSEIRVKGGAYGLRVDIAKSTGAVYVSSYRDPNVAASYAVYESISDYLKNFDCSDQEFMTYLIGAFGGFDMPESCNSSISSFDSRYLCGITDDSRRQTKKEMLTATKKDIVAYAALFDGLKEKGASYTVGNETKMKEYGKLDPIDTL